MNYGYVRVSSRDQNEERQIIAMHEFGVDDNVVAELVNGLVRENASTAQSQDAYLRKYEALTQRYEAAKAELERLQKERTLRSQQDKAMALFIRTLKKQPEVLDAWDDTVWTVMVEKAIVHRDGTITFVFYNGTEIAVERQAA